MAEENVCAADWHFSFFGPIHIPASHLTAAIENPDSIQLAASMGRFDVLMIVLAILAFIGFFVYRRVVEHAARDQTKAVCPELVASYLKENPSILRQAIKDHFALVGPAVAGVGDGSKEECGEDFSADIARGMEGGSEQNA